MRRIQGRKSVTRVWVEPSDDRWQKVLGIQLQIYCVVYFRT